MWHVSSRSGVATLRTAIDLLLTQFHGPCGAPTRPVEGSIHGPCSAGQVDQVDGGRSRGVRAHGDDETR